MVSDDFLDNETPTEAEQALYLVAELSSLLRRARPGTWPRLQAALFRRRLREISRQTSDLGPGGTLSKPRR